MLFSVIIPVYNVEEYLRQSIDSVLSQEETDIEIILVDDGSTDSSGEICDEYQKKNPNIIKVIHKSNEGLLLTRRCGIRAARGEWFVHLDSDDFMMPGVLRSVHEAIDNYNPDLVICKIAYGAEDGKSIAFYSQLPFYNEQIFDSNNRNTLYEQFLLGGYLSAIYQKIAKREIVDIDNDYSKWDRVSIAEDVLQSLYILQNSKKSIYLDKTIVYYRHNNDSITKKRNTISYIKNCWSYIDVFAEEKRYYTLWSVSNEMRTDIASKHCRTLCSQIRQMMQTMEKSERAIVQKFLIELRANGTWNWLFHNDNRKKTGKFSVLCYYMIQMKCMLGLHVLCNLF